MKKILLTGFEPFHKASSNPTQAIVLQLQSEQIPGLITEVLPVEFETSSKRLCELIDLHRPDIVIALGQAEGRNQITPEQIAINLDDARIPDNAGNQPSRQRIILNAPDGLFSTLPIDEIIKMLQRSEIPASVSLSAGTFVCNHVFYAMQHYCLGKNINTGFIHVPLMDSQATEFPGLPTLPLETLVKAIKEVLSLFN